MVWHEKLPALWKPVIVMAGLCLLVALLLVPTNLATAPAIAGRAAEAKTAAAREVLPEADGFTDVEVGEALAALGCLDASRADNGAGYVVTVETKGFGGGIELLVGFDADGKVTGVVSLDAAETQGVGTKALAGEYLAGYAGNNAANIHIDMVTGATVTSRAVLRGVQNAGAIFELLKGGE